MRKTLSLVALALCLTAPLRAAEVGRVVEVPPELGSVAGSAPSATAAPLSAPALSAAPGLTAAAAAAPSAAPLAAPAAAAAGPSAAPAAAAAPALPAMAAPAPAAGPKAARGLSDVVRDGSGRALFDGVFIQQEHEGSLIAPDPRDSSGNVFRYYRPVEFRPELSREVTGSLTGFSKAVYATRRFFQFGGRSAPDAQWRAWPLHAKLDYLDRLEKAVTVERGTAAAWDGKVSLILEKKAGAPDFVTKNPHMEPPPDRAAGTVGARFLQPEIVSAKDRPASSVAEALGRARQVIADTGHAGVQFHVFVKSAPADLLAQVDALGGALQIVNDVLFAKAAVGAEANIAHPSLLPWHDGRTARVRALIAKAAAGAHVPAAADPDSEKHAFVGFRWWGMEDGKAVVSLELRGASLPWKRPAQSKMVRDMESAPAPKRDYEEARTYLTLLAVYAEALAKGRAPRALEKPVVLDEKAADAYLAARAEALGVPASAFDGLGAFARRMTGAKTAPAGYLFPFAASAPDSPELRAFADEIVVLAARAKAAEDAGARGVDQHQRYLFWSAYQGWASGFGARREAALSRLVAGL